jgi:hypothetical protein
MNDLHKITVWLDPAGRSRPAPRADRPADVHDLAARNKEACYGRRLGPPR